VRTCASRAAFVPQAAPAAPQTFKSAYEFVKGEELGKGQFSVVLKARKKTTGELFAVKCIKKSEMTPEDIDALVIEKRVMRKVRGVVTRARDPARPPPPPAGGAPPAAHLLCEGTRAAGWSSARAHPRRRGVCVCARAHSSTCGSPARPPPCS
jgi:hypothetical protein